MVVILSLSFSQKINASNFQKSNEMELLENKKNLIGKKLQYDYGQNVFEITFISENKLHWKCIEGEYKGQEATENYKIQKLSKHRFFVSWVEKDGISVSQVVNLKNKNINTFMVVDKEIYTMNGTLKELK